MNRACALVYIKQARSKVPLAWFNFKLFFIKNPQLSLNPTVSRFLTKFDKNFRIAVLQRTFQQITLLRPEETDRANIM